ncbi:hypothetical protein SAY86_023370 [Trapa natans]|uniref:Mechanosensitive ion channel protein Msy1/2-like transmembrane domain-containing protein n=1 Tax=Trapa natans TaxID=22666 RepID=A0AAN7R9A2_TRANT|nr:hypothetical protein SAY86_023370 [Trapa natans]
MEVSRGGETERKDKNDVVVYISGSESESRASTVAQAGSSLRLSPELAELPALRVQPGAQNSSSTGSPAQEAVKSSPCPTPGKPPRSPAHSLTNRTLSRSSFSKPKSRFQEPAYSTNAEETIQPNNVISSPFRASPMASPQNKNVGASSPKDNLKTVPVTPRTPLIPLTGDGEDEEDEDDEVYKTANLKVQEMSSKKYNKYALLEWAAFVCIMTVLIASITADRLQKTEIWSLRLWRWCLLVLVIFCGRLVTSWLINMLVFLIEMNFLLKKKVLYFVFGLKKSVQAFLWIGLILLAWGLLISHGAERTKNTTKILNRITKGLAACLIGAAIWLVKTLLIKLLASSFQCTRFFDRIQESIFHQYIVRTLSGLPLMEMAEQIGSSKTTSSGRLSFRKVKKDSAREDVIDVDKLHKMKQGKVSAWTMKGLIDVIGGSGLSTLSGSLNADDEDDDDAKKNKEITNEWEAKAAAYRIFMNVAKPGSKFIDEEDLLRFMKKEDVDNVIPLFEGAAEKKKIKRSALKNWLIKVYLERKSLAHSLNDAKTAIEELNRLASAVVIFVIIIVWLLMMGFLTTKVLVFLSSQLLVAVFVFGNTAKTVFEAIIFVFVMHPFDVGDRCVIGGLQVSLLIIEVLVAESSVLC